MPGREFSERSSESSDNNFAKVVLTSLFAVAFCGFGIYATVVLLFRMCNTFDFINYTLRYIPCV